MVCVHVCVCEREREREGEAGMDVAKGKVLGPGFPGSVKQTRGPRAMCSPGLSAEQRLGLGPWPETRLAPQKHRGRSVRCNEK